MKRTILLAGFLMALMIVPGCVSMREPAFVKRSYKVQKIKLRTRGEAGQHFTAKLNIDGREREISGVSPAEFPLEACVVTGTVRKTNGDGTLGFQIIERGSTLGFGALEDTGQTCRFRYHANGIEVWN